jgi:ferrous iron transport protein A
MISPALIPLNHLRQGQSAHVGRVEGHPDHVHRLSELGIRGGCQVEMFRPGNPCIIRIAGNKVCIRSDRGLRVLVQPCDAA